MNASGAIESQVADAVRTRIELCFRQIETERMSGIPILNRALRVEVVGIRRFGAEWLCILLTPWFMNVMLLPDAVAAGPAQDAASPAAVGSKSTVVLPAGRFEMIQGFEAGLGHYRMCSLFSPVLEFADHESAVQAAEAALAALFDRDSDDDADAGMEMIWRGERPMDPRGDDASDPATTDTAPVAAEKDGRFDTGEPATALSRRRLLLGRIRTEGPSER